MDESKLDSLVGSVSRIAAIQEQTVKNIDRLTTDVRELAHDRCSKDTCALIGERLNKLENKPAPHQCPIGEHIQMIKDINIRVNSIEATRAWIVKIVISVVTVALLTLVVHKGSW